MPIDEAACERAACTLESALAMTDMLNPDEKIAIEMSRMELSSFVNYMRELDKQYRHLASIQPKHGDARKYIHDRR